MNIAYVGGSRVMSQIFEAISFSEPNYHKWQDLKEKKLKIFIIYLLPVINVKNGSNIALLSCSLVNLTFWKKILNCISFFANFKENSHFDLKKECKEAHYSWNLATLIAFFVNFLKELQNWKVGQVKPICIESINQSINLSIYHLFILKRKRKW